MDTIFAPICPLGGSIVSVRFSGENAFELLNFFGVNQDKYKDTNLFFTTLKYKNEVIDEVVVKIFKKPHSFTGENVVEVDLHASRIILKRFLELSSKIPNFRFAKNGDFTRRAFLNGKVDLIKSEGINAIIRAETEQQYKIANEMFYGNIKKQYQEIRNKLIEAMSYVETQIDFSEEEIPDEIVKNVKTITASLIEKISQCLQDKKAIDKINQGVSVAIIGKPNTGKSSLLNFLAKRDIAIVSPIAGTTRDILNVDVEINGYKATFYDTAGIRDTDDLIESEGVNRAKNIAKNADICIFMCDNVEDYIETKNENKDKDNVIFVINKLDERKENIKDIEENCIELSVLNQINLDVLIEKIGDKILKQVELKQNPLVFNERHAVLLKNCIECLERIDFDTMPIEIIGEELRCAIDCIGQITGQIYTDDILDVVFSKFCIGK